MIGLSLHLDEEELVLEVTKGQTFASCGKLHKEGGYKRKRYRSEQRRRAGEWCMSKLFIKEVQDEKIYTKGIGSITAWVN